MADRSDSRDHIGRVAAVAALTIVAALLRIPLLSRPMGNDEAASFIYYASHPLSVIVTIYGSPNNHILHSILMHASYRMFGGAEWALRLPAFLAGIAIVPLTYIAASALGRPSSAASRHLLPASGEKELAADAAREPLAQRSGEKDLAADAAREPIAQRSGEKDLAADAAREPLAPRSGERVAEGRVRGQWIATALAASAPVLIDYSTDARGYTLLCCFVLICTIAIARGAWRTFAISAALGFYTVPVMLYPFLMLVIWGRRKAIVPAIEAIVIAAALYAPALIVSGAGAIASNPYVRPLPIGQFFRGLVPYLASVRGHLLIGIPIVVQVIIAIGFVIAVRRFPIWIGFAAVVIIVALQRVLPFPRVWLPFLILALITAAAAWPWERSEPIVAAALVIALALTGFTTERLRETGELRAVREMTRELNLRARPGEPVLALQPSEMPLAFYCTRVEVLNPDVTRPRLFAVENRDYGQSLARTLAYFRIDPRKVAIRKLRDFGSSALYELRR